MPISAQEVQVSTMDAYHLEKRADSQDSIEEVGQLSTSTSRGAFPQEYVCERESVFCASSEMDPELP